VLLVVILSATGSANEKASSFEPATYEVTADPDDYGENASTDPTRIHRFSAWLSGPRQHTPVKPPLCLNVSDGQPAQESSPVVEDQTNSDRVSSAADTKSPELATLRSAPTKTRPLVPQFLRTAVQDAATQPQVPEDFDFASARIALVNAAGNARSCPGSSIRGKVIVTFDPSGQARAVDIPLLIGDGVDRDCIARTFLSVHVPRFTGGAVAVKKDF
jgi:hypothetical protein